MGIDALLSTVSETFATQPQTTILPAFTDSRKRAHAFLVALRERGQAVELRTGRSIGQGGMGVVHEAEQVALGRVVAVKTLKPERTDPEAAQDLLREAWVTGALEHPNVVPIHHLEIAGDTPLLIMKRVDGVEWSALVRDAAEVQHRFGTDDLLGWNLGIFQQVLNALRFAHSRGIIHRDLKPSNVMIGNFGEVYLLDWGIAVSLREDERFPLAREVTELAGTPAYMAPEMLGPDVGIPLGEYTDVYLAGAVLYEIVVGHPPHRGPNPPAIIASIVTSEPAIPASVAPELAAICRRALHATPGDRFTSITELQDAVRGYLEHRGSSQLAARVRGNLSELLVLCTDMAPRDVVHRTLAVCRFGFHEALAAWRENTDARDGLARALVAVAEYELRSGDPRSAITLLDELPEKHALRDTAQSAVAEADKRRAAFDRMELEQDPRPGLNVRWAVAILVGVVYTIGPLIGFFWPSMRVATHFHQLVIAALSLATCVAVALYWRRKTRITYVNRAIFMGAFVLFSVQMMLTGGAMLLHLSGPQTQALMLLTWGGLAAVAGVMFDRALIVSAVADFGAFILAATSPDLSLLAIALANTVFTLVVTLRWRSGDVRTPLAAVPASRSYDHHGG